MTLLEELEIAVRRVREAFAAWDRAKEEQDRCLEAFERAREACMAAGDEMTMAECAVLELARPVRGRV